MGFAMARWGPLRNVARVTAVSVSAGIVAYALRMGWPWLGQMDQPLLRRYLGTADSAPFLVVEVGPEDFSRRGFAPGSEEMRSVYADLLTKLDQAGAKGIVFDLQFEEARAPEPSRRLEEAIRQSSVPVIVPAIEAYRGEEGSRFEKPPFLPDDSPVYYGSARGHPELGIADLVGGDEVEPFFHIGLLAAAVARGLDPYDDVDWYEGRLTLGNQTIPVDRSARLLLPESDPPSRIGLSEALRTPDAARGRVAIVGQVQGRDRHASPFGTVEGVDFVARVAAAAFRPSFRSLAPGWASFLVATLLAGLAAGSSLGLRWGRALGGALAAMVLALWAPSWLAGSVGSTSPVMSLVAIALAATATLLGESFTLRRRVYGRAEPIDEEATVMFVDLVGSTPLVRELGPAEADRVMSAVVQRLADTVERLGAEIERPLGDGVLVHWRSGDPADQVSRCLEAITRLRAAVIDVPIPGLPMGFLPRLTFGIEHGRIVGSPVTIRGLPQWMSSGETVHLAARLQSLCGSLEQDCLVGPVAGLLAGEDRVRPVSEVEVKGFGTVVVFAPR